MRREGGEAWEGCPQSGRGPSPTVAKTATATQSNQALSLPEMYYLGLGCARSLLLDTLGIHNRATPCLLLPGARERMALEKSPGLWLAILREERPLDLGRSSSTVDRTL